MFSLTLAANEATKKPKYYYPGMFAVVYFSLLCTVIGVALFSFGERNAEGREARRSIFIVQIKPPSAVNCFP
jgi:hypothetical protein